MYSIKCMYKHIVDEVYINLNMFLKNENFPTTCTQNVKENDFITSSAFVMVSVEVFASARIQIEMKCSNELIKSIRITIFSDVMVTIIS